jgi:hypothetical protein
MSFKIQLIVLLKDRHTAKSIIYNEKLFFLLCQIFQAKWDLTMGEGALKFYEHGPSTTSGADHTSGTGYPTKLFF